MPSDLDYGVVGAGTDPTTSPSSGDPVSAGDVTTFEWPPAHWGFTKPEEKKAAPDPGEPLSELERQRVDKRGANAPQADPLAELERQRVAHASTPTLTPPPRVTLPWEPGPVTQPSQVPSHTGQPPGPPITDPRQLEQQPVTQPGQTPTPPDSMPPEDANSLQPSGLTRGQEDEVRQRAANPEAFAGVDAARAASAKIQAYKDKATADAALAKQAVDDHQSTLNAFAKTQRDSAAVMADAQVLMSRKLNPGRVKMGPLEAIGVMLGGLAGGYFGTGQNAALQQWNMRREQDIDAQKSDLANAWKGIDLRNNAIAQEYARHGDLDRAETAYRLEQHQRALDKIDTDLQLVDPNGQIARSYMAARQQVQAQQRQALLDFEKKRMDDYKAKAEITDKLATARSAKQGLRNPEIEAAMGLQPSTPTGTGAPVATYGKTYGSLNEIPPKLLENTFPMPTINGQPGGFGIAANKDQALDMTHLTQMREQANHDINELKRIALEHENAKTGGAQALDRWKSDYEQEYDRLSTDLANVYGLIIHGRSPTTGVLEEVRKDVVPKLKGFLDRGDTALQLDKFGDEIDNRSSLRLTGITGSKVAIKTDRPHIDPVNINTLAAPLLSKPVRGDAGFARTDVADIDQRLKAVRQQYIDKPGIGGSEGFASQLGDFAKVQQNAIDAITARNAELKKKPKLSTTESTELAQNERALADRQQALAAIKDAQKDTNVDVVREKERERQERQEAAQRLLDNPFTGRD